MKKLFVIFALLIGTTSLISCDKTNDDEWNRFFGYSKADIIGHYESTPNEEYYSEMPTQGVTVHRNVTIDIADAGGESYVNLHIVIPDIINVHFTGAVQLNGNDSDMAFNNNTTYTIEDFLVTVYKDKNGHIRMHGRERNGRKDSEGEVISCKTRCFDVIKMQ